jgi:hypothetical protein
MDKEGTSWAAMGRVLRLAALFGLVTGAVWGTAFGWRGLVLGVVGAASVVGIFVLTQLFSLRIALVVATLTVFLLLMFGTSGSSGEWP